MGSLFLIAGVFLALYYPAIPFITWVTTIIGWLLLVIESLIAAPVWAVTHAVSTDEGGFAIGPARQGYMFIITVVAYPLLAIIGLVLGTFVTYWGALFLFQAFEPFAVGLMSGAGSGPVAGGLGFLFQLFLFIILLLGIQNKSYTLCYELPASVLRWVGAGQSGLAGEAGSSQDMKSLFLAGYAKTGTGISQLNQQVAKMSKKITAGQDGKGGASKGATQSNPEKTPPTGSPG